MDDGSLAMPFIYLDFTRSAPGWWANTPARLALVFLVTLAFALLGYLIRGVSRSGAAAGAVACFVLFAAVGPGALAALLFLFVITWLATRMGRTRKLLLGTAERSGGRTASQVFANLGIACVCSVMHATRGWTVLAMSAALAEAAADTVSSEVGQAFHESARLITTFQPVPAGTNGGITLAGTLAGALAAGCVSLVCAATGLLTLRQLWATTAFGVLGMLIDSHLGALVERRGWLRNDAVNFFSTTAAALMALGFVVIFD